MADQISIRRKKPRVPVGCEGYLTRRQAAQMLGFPSEFKIRQLERDGRLRSIRGPMRTAFYSRGDVLSVKAELARMEPGRSSGDDWTDADLIDLLEHRGQEGRPSTQLDLVLETRISIERAQKVYSFWDASRRTTAPLPSAGRPTAAPSPSPPAAQQGQSDRPPSRPSEERRSAERQSRDALIEELRHPDPRVRQQAFARLKQDRDRTGPKPE